MTSTSVGKRHTCTVHDGKHPAYKHTYTIKTRQEQLCLGTSVPSREESRQLNKDIDLLVGTFLRNQREGRNIRIGEISRRMCTDKRHVMLIETGQRPLVLGRLDAYADAFDISENLLADRMFDFVLSNLGPRASGEHVLDHGTATGK